MTIVVLDDNTLYNNTIKRTRKGVIRLIVAFVMSALNIKIYINVELNVTSNK